MVTISNIKWTYESMSKIKVLYNLLASKMKEELKIKISGEVADNIIKFTRVEPNRLFISTVTNKIMIKDNDARVKKLGRNYLETHKPTEKQYLGFFNTINKYLDDLGLSADVQYEVKDKTHVLRTGKVKFEVPKLNTYPKEKV